MRTRIFGNVASLFVPTAIALLLAGCGASGIGGIRGPSAVLQSAEVDSGSSNAAIIVNALARDNKILRPDGGFDYPTYYQVAQAGFNFIDDQCAVYFDKLFYLQRDRQFAQDVLQAGNQATAAVLTLTRASVITFGVVAAAFGFSSSAADSVAGSFLFQLPPATTYGFVKEMQAAYRRGVKPQDINSPADAYHVMQDYLAICLPPNIEARILERVSNARVVANPGSESNPAPTLTVGDRVSPPEIRKVVETRRIVVINNVKAPLGNPTPRPQPNAEGLNAAERSLAETQIRKWQTALCVDGDTGGPVRDGALGAIHSPTRAALRQYLISKGQKFDTDGHPVEESDTSDASYILTVRDITFLNFMLKPGDNKCPGE